MHARLTDPAASQSGGIWRLAVKGAGGVAVGAAGVLPVVLCVGVAGSWWSSWLWAGSVLVLWLAQGLGGMVCLFGGVPLWYASRPGDRTGLGLGLVGVATSMALVQGSALMGVLVVLSALASMGR